MRQLKSIIILVLLFMIYLGAAFYRSRLSRNPELFDPHNSIAYYWTENALQYHYADLISQGRPIPAFDPDLQAPEGVRIFENLTILMEYPAGGLYRLLGLHRQRYPLHSFLIFYTAFFSALIVFGLYGGSRVLGYTRGFSLLAAGLGVFSYVFVGRSIQAFLNEDFSLPLFFLGLVLVMTAVDRPRRDYLFALAAGICFALSLAGWHLSRFLFLGFTAAAVFNLLVFTAENEIIKPAKILFFTTLITWLASLFVPVLRARGYFLSPAFALVFGAAAAVWCFRGVRRRPLRIAAVLAILTLSIILTAILKLEVEYGHVWSLFLNKIRFLGMKPANPALVPSPARSLWIEAFNSPSPRLFAAQFFPLILPAAGGAYALIRKQGRNWNTRLFLILSLAFFLLYLSVERMSVVANFFMAVLAVGIGLWPARRRTRLAVAAVIILMLVFNFYQGYHLHEGTGYFRLLNRWSSAGRPTFTNNRVNDLDLVYYVRHATSPGSIFLSRYSVGPLLLAYAGRPIALQPKFEVKGCRQRVKEFYQGMYGTEDDLYDLCQRWRISYLLYDIRILLDASRDSDRWVADQLNIKPTVAAFRLHFLPESLKHFQLAYQNSTYRLYRVLAPDSVPDNRAASNQPVYDLSQYGGQIADRPFYDDRWNAEMANRLQEAFAFLRAAQSVLVHDPARAVRLAEKAQQRCPGLTGSATILGIAYCLVGRDQEGYALCRQEAEERPYFPLAHYNLAYALIRQERYEEARAELDRTLMIDPAFEPAREMRKELEEIR